VAGYRLLIKTSAAKELQSAGSKYDRQRIAARIQSLAADPRPPGAEKLVGYTDQLRVRQGDYRIVYGVDDDRREVTIFRIGHRKDVYR
jgi:mRNA interferase RelE/StbE